MSKDKDTPETAPQAPDPWAVLNRVASAMEGLTDAVKSGKLGPQDESKAGELMVKLSGAMERMADANLQGSKLIADETRRSHRPSNEVPTGVSVFNRRGGHLTDKQLEDAGPHKPPLKCIMLLPWLAEWESLTREEVELLNLLKPGSYVVKRIDNSKVSVTVQMDMREDMVTPSRLLMNHDTAFNNDNFKLMPPLADMLRYILSQHSTELAVAAKRVMTDEEEEALIEAGKISIAA